MRAIVLLSAWAFVLPAVGVDAQDARPLASPEMKLLLERLKEREARLMDVQLKLSAFTRLLFNPQDAAGLDAISRRSEPRFRPLDSINRDGTDLRMILAAPGMITTGTPQWSHDGKMIVVDSTSETDAVVQSRIWAYGVAGAFRGMIRYLGAGNTPSWSPDGKKIIFSSER